MEQLNKNEISYCISENFDELAPFLDIDLPYPFTADMFNLLKKENLYPQKYYFCRRKESYALLSPTSKSLTFSPSEKRMSA